MPISKNLFPEPSIGNLFSKQGVLQMNEFSLDRLLAKTWDIVPPGTFQGEDEVPPGTFHGEDEVPPGTFHGADEVPPGTFHGEDEVPPGTFHG